MSPNTIEHHQSLRECPSRPLWLPLSPRRVLHRGSSSHHGCSRRRPSETSNRHRRRQEAKASYCIITFRKLHGMFRESRDYQGRQEILPYEFRAVTSSVDFRPLYV